MSLPRWEIEAWRALFDIIGPLDWKRTDLLLARVNQYQAGDPDALLKDFILFSDPTVKEDPEQARREREKELLYKLGYREE